MTARRSRVAGTALVVVFACSLVLGGWTGSGAAVDPADPSTAAAAVAWLVDQQEDDGGFELADFPGFETPDAVAAIAVNAQTTDTWSATEARAAVESLEYGGSGGPTPIDALDDWVVTAGTPDPGDEINAGQAAKLVVLVIAPLGLDVEAFGPSATDVAALIYPSGCAAAPATAGIFFLQTVYVALAGDLLCGAPDADVLQSIRDAQRADGGWNYNGSTAPANPDDPFDPNLPDVDATALAMQALVAGGAAWNDPAILEGLTYLAGQQSATGAFPAFGSDDPNATAVGMLAIAAAGFDPNASCWRDTAVPATAGTPYAAPNAWIRSQQQSDGRIASPNDDGYGINTLATSQSVQGLLRSWTPIARAGGAPTCPVAAPPDPIALVPRFTG